MIKDGKCPMTKEILGKHPLTEKQQNAFCAKGCSVECGKFFMEYTNKLEKRQKHHIKE